MPIKKPSQKAKAPEKILDEKALDKFVSGVDGKDSTPIKKKLKPMTFRASEDEYTALLDLKNKKGVGIQSILHLALAEFIVRNKES